MVTKRVMRKTVVSFLGAGLFLSSSFVYAGGTSFAYENPAALNLVKQAEVTVGATVPNLSYNFSGSDGPFQGSTSSHTTRALSYGRVAWRINPSLVVGLDVTRPLYVDFEFPSDSFLKYSAVNTVLLDVDYSPKLSYQVTDQLALGIGLNANNLTEGKLSVFVPPYGILDAAGDSWAYGWNVGLSYALPTYTFLNLSYFSKVTHNEIKGKSTWGNGATDDLLNFTLPTTISANVVQILSPAWAVSATARFLKWGDESSFTLINSALAPGAAIPYPLNFHNSWTASLGTRYQLNDKWAVNAFGEYDSNNQPKAFRLPAFPTGHALTLGGGLEYAFTPSLSGRFIYAYAAVNSPVDIASPTGGRTVGDMKLRGNIFDLSLSWKM